MKLKTKYVIFTNLTTSNTSTAVENKKLDHCKYIITLEFNKLIAENFIARLKLANLAAKGDIGQNTDFDDKLKKNK